MQHVEVGLPLWYVLHPLMHHQSGLIRAVYRCVQVAVCCTDKLHTLIQSSLKSIVRLVGRIVLESLAESEVRVCVYLPVGVGA